MVELSGREVLEVEDPVPCNMIAEAHSVSMVIGILYRSL